MEKVKKILIILAISLFIGNYHICNYFYPGNSQTDINNWWDLKSNIYAVIMMIVFLSAQIGTKGLLRFFLSIGVGFAISNVIDKCYFNVLEFTKADIYMIIITVLFSFYDWFKNSKYYKINKTS
jgi:hypothetical protein